MVVNGLFSAYKEMLVVHYLNLVFFRICHRVPGDRLMGELSYNFDESCNELRHLLNQARMNNVYAPIVQTEASWNALNEQVSFDVQPVSTSLCDLSLPLFR